MSPTWQSAAREALRFFERATNHSGKTIWVLKDKRPDVLFWAVYDAHGSKLPDDHAFEFIVESLREFAEEGEDAPAPEPDTYTQELLAWIASSTLRAEYVDTVLEEMWPGGRTREDVPSFVDLLSRAQAVEREGIHAHMAAYLSERLAEGSE